MKCKFIHTFFNRFFPFLVIISLPILFLGKAALGQETIVLGDFTGSDLLDLHYPFKSILTSALKEKSLPLWTSLLANGFPIFAEGQTGVFYPPNLFFSLLHPLLALNYTLILALIIAGVGMYLYASLIFKEKFAPLVAAVTFAFSAFFITRLKHVNLINVASLFPLSLYFLKKFFQTQKLAYGVAAGVVLGMTLLAGHPQMAFYNFFIFFLVFLFELYLFAKQKGTSIALPKGVLAISLIVIVAVGLSAIQVLPTLEFLRFTERLEFSYQTATSYPFNPKNLITFFSPFYFGNPATGSYREDIRITGIFWENASYFGLLPFALSLLSVIRIIIGRERNLFLRFLLGLAIFSLVIMLGRFTPLFNLLWTYIPGFSLFRFPTRFNLYLLFSLALLAAHGFAILTNQLVKLRLSPKKETLDEEKLSLSWPLDKKKTEISLLGFIVLDLFVFGKTYVGTIPSQDFLKKPQIVQFLEQDKTLFRVYSLSQYSDSPYQFIGWKKDVGPLLDIREALPPNQNALFNLASFTDRGWFEGGLSLARRNELERLIFSQADPLVWGKVLGLFNVKYLINFQELGGVEMEKVKEITLGKSFATSVKVFENKQALPRVYFVPEAKVLPKQDVPREIFAPDFYPLRTVLLETKPDKELPQFEGALEKFQQDNPIEIKKYSDLEVIIEVDLKNDGFLVLSDTYYPGWKVMIDNKKAKILTANWLVRAVELAPGKHTIKFVYDPLSFKIGAGMTGFTFLGVLVAGFFLLRKRKSAARPSKRGRKQ